MKKLLLLFAVLSSTVGAWAQATATIGVSTNESNPEKVYTLKMLNGYWMTSKAAPTKSFPAKFAFFADGEVENAYKIYCVDNKQWLSYEKADSYANGTGKGKFVDTRAGANSWNFTTSANGGVSCYQISPIKNDGKAASIYWNWIYGVGQYNPENGEVTIGYYTGDAASDKGSAWVLTELTIPTTGTEYMLEDKCGTYLDLLHYGVETNSAAHNQLATMNAEPQPLYVTTVDGDNWTWKIHTEAQGGKYLHQSSTRQWNSWVSENGGDFNWKVELVVADNEIFYALKHESGKENGYLGGDNHSAGKELYVNNQGANQKLKLTLAEAKVVYNFKLEDEIQYTQTFYTKKGVEYPDFTIEIPEGLTATKPVGNVTKLYEVIDIKLNYSNLPFEVTTIKNGVFAEDTKWYYLTMRNKGVTYDPTTGMALANDPATKDAKNMFAFVGNPVDGYSIYNYVAGVDKVFWRGDDANGGRIYFTKKSETNGNTWELHANGDKGYVFKLKGTANGWMNDHKNDLAIWNYGLGATDDGSTITFAEVSADELLANVKDYLPTVVEKANPINEFKGDWVGYYSVRETFDGAYASATAITESSALYDIISATCLLQTAVENTTFNLPDPNKFYAIKSTSTQDYCAGRYVHTIPTSSTRPSQWGDKTYDHRHLVFDAIEEIDPTILWHFTEDMKMKNVHTGEYVKSFQKDADHMGTSSESQVITLKPLGEGQVSLQIGNNSPMHAQNDNQVIVAWSGGKGTASSWIFEEVEEFSYTATVTNAGWSTLVLGFNAEIPEELEAYAVSSTDNGYAKLTHVTGVLPAGEAVVLKNAGEHKFAYSSTTPATVENNLLEGTLFDTNVRENAYVLSKGASGIGFYLAAMNQADETAFKNNANKAYLPTTAVTTADARFLVFSFGDDVETAIENIEGENGNVNAEIYDLAGRRVQNAQKGVFIVNGKVVIK